MTKKFCNRCDKEIKGNAISVPHPLILKEYGDGDLCDKCIESLNKWMDRKD